MSKKKKDLKGLERKIKSFIGSKPNKEFNYKQIAFSLGVNDTKGRNDIIKILNKLLKKEQIIRVNKGKFVAPGIQSNTAEGVLEITSTGRGYVVCEDLDADVLVEQRNLNRGLHGDIVSVAVGERKNKNKYEGKIIDIIERKKDVFVGVYEKNKDYAFVNTRNARMYTDFFIDKDEMKGYQEGEKVAVEIKSWDSPKNSPEGKIIKSFGFGDDSLDAYSILYEYGLSTEFEDRVEEEEAAQPTQESPSNSEDRAALAALGCIGRAIWVVDALGRSRQRRVARCIRVRLVCTHESCCTGWRRAASIATRCHRM